MVTAQGRRTSVSIIAAGSPVEVLCTLTDRWVPGFEAIFVGSLGCRVRRQYDRRVIPEIVPFERLRPL